MAQRVKMDWVLFWTILGLVAVGLVMVYSASSALVELKRPATENAEVARTLSMKDSRLGLRVLAGLLGVLALAVMIRRWRHNQLPMTWAVAGVFGVALLQLLAYWIALDRTPHYTFLLRQGAAALGSFFALMIISQRDYRLFHSERWAFGALGIVIFLLILVFFVDSEQHRWFKVGIALQPSEFAKPAMILFLAWFVAVRKSAINDPHTVWPAALTLTVLAGCVVIADLGTAVVLVAAAAAIFYLAGLNRRYTLAAICVGCVLLTGAVVSRPYRLLRVIQFVDPEYKLLVLVDPDKRILEYARKGSVVEDTGFQPLQAKLAVGSGGATGLGLMQSRQKLFLPEPHTDFIFAILAEETGLWGSAIVLTGFLIILWRGYRLYWSAADDFGKYLAIGVTTTLVFQALINISVVLNLGPTKGFPLPLVSFGGSALLSSMISLGLLLSVSQRAAHP
jgi:cell division protein FtsW